MLKKAKIKIAAWGLTGLIGAGGLFSGLAAQSVYAGEPAEVNVTESATDDSGVLNASSVEFPVVTDAAEESLPVEETQAQQDATDVINVTEVKTEDTADITPKNETKTTGGVGAAKEIGNTKAAEATRAAKNGWVKENGGYKYYKDGKTYTGWHKMGKAEGEKTEHWSYFGKNGIVYTGWKKMGKAEGEKTAHWCYFGSNGWLRTGWVQFGKGTTNPDGNVTKHWSYFGTNGWLRTGWVQFGKGTSEPDGNVAKHWSYFGSNGWLRTGWVQLGKGTSEPDGNVAKHWSYFGSNGWLRTGWVQLGKGTSEPDGNVAKHWSYFGDNGWMRTGWQDMGKGTKNPDGNSAKHKSYFGNNGWMRTGTQIISDRQYTFDNKGWLRENYDIDVFMNFLRSKYKNADKYADGYPVDYLYKEYGWEEQYIKYAIADFDGDNQNELLILVSSYALLGNGARLYERNGNNVTEREKDARSFGIGMTPLSEKMPSMTFYNNGVLTFYHDSIKNQTYHVFNPEIRNKNGYDDYSPFWYVKSGDSVQKWSSGHERSYTTISLSEYNKQIKLLNSGKKLNVELKDMKAKNLNI